MKKKTTSRTAGVIKRIFRVREWADMDRTKSYTQYLIDGFKKFFVPQKAQKNESFEEAVKQFNVSEADLEAKQNALYRLAMLMLVIAFGMFGYSIYCMLYGSFMSVMLSFVVVALALALAFRYHFWYFQISRRKLGCTLTEWFHEGLRGTNHE